MWNKIWLNEKVYDTIAKLIAPGGRYMICSDSESEAYGKIIPRMQAMVLWSPWIMVRYPKTKCDVWNFIFYKEFGIHPTFCRENCYKVVVYPKTFAEMYRLYEAMEGWYMPSKVGFETRSYIPDKPSNYAAFFYCNSEEDGQKKYSVVRRLVTEVLGEDTKVILKQGCTEMELDKGVEPDPDLETRLNDIFYMGQEKGSAPPAWVKNGQIQWWLKYARTIGDETYKEICELPADQEEYKTYHGGK
jgi:hypothetical protein